MKTYSLCTRLTTTHEVAHTYPLIQQRVPTGGSTFQAPSHPNVLFSTNWPQDPCLTPQLKI